MYFNVDDIIFLNSKDFKRYKKINKWLSNDDFEPDSLAYIIGIFICLLMTILLFIRWGFFSWHPSEEGVIKTIAYIVSLFFFIGLPIMFLSMMIFVLLVYPIFKYIIQWILRNFIIKKQYLIQGNIYAVNEGRIKNIISSYINDGHNRLINELSDINIGFERFNELKNEYIENYSFIKSVHNTIGDILGISFFLSKAKEIIETLIYHNPIDSQRNNLHISSNEKSERDSSQISAQELPPLEKRINEIINREAKPDSPSHKKTPIKKILINRKSKKNISDEEQEKEKTDRLFEKTLKNVKRLNYSTPKTFNINPAKINWTEVNNKRKTIGDAGELIVYNYEIEKLLDYDLIELIPKVEHSSQIYGDGCGYDIKSFNEKGQELYIEVKTTQGQFNNPIYFSKNELDKMKELGEDYCLYRVHNLNIADKTGKISIYSGCRIICENFEFIPETIKARPK